jgi:hypothetical protein
MPDPDGQVNARVHGNNFDLVGSLTLAYFVFSRTHTGLVLAGWPGRAAVFYPRTHVRTREDATRDSQKCIGDASKIHIKAVKRVITRSTGISFRTIRLSGVPKRTG